MAADPAVTGRPMKVLHLWLGDAPNAGGGGAGSMFRLNESLRQAGADSRILCETKTTGSEHVLTKPGPSLTERVLKQVTMRVGLNDIHRISSHRLHHHPVVREADILNFHGIHTGFFSYLALPVLTAHKPVVFTLRDMWPMTGHCAVPGDCTRWKTGCGKCPYPETYPPVRRDATRMEWWLKNRAYGRSDLTIVALSEWLASQARESMLRRFPIHTIGNGVDTDVYVPRDRDHCRDALGIPRDRLVLMFAATNLASPRKGGNLLVQALEDLPDDLKAQTVCLVMGSGGKQYFAAAGVTCIDLGYVSNERLKALAYSAADLFVSPSLGEAFGQTILESMACGTPVVAFDLGPMPELVRDGVTGSTVTPMDSAGLSWAIAELLRNRALREEMGRAGRRMAETEYARAVEAERYLALYRQVLGIEPDQPETASDPTSSVEAELDSSSRRAS